MEQRQESETIKEREMRVKGRENGETGQEGIERGERAGQKRRGQEEKREGTAERDKREWGGGKRERRERDASHPMALTHRHPVNNLEPGERVFFK